MPPDPKLRRAKFREIARDIIATDRHNRKYGITQDLAGTITRALEKAYRQGHEEALLSGAPGGGGEIGPSSVVPEGVEWIMIPPRPRSAFWTICLRTFGKNVVCSSDKVAVLEWLPREGRWLYRKADCLPELAALIHEYFRQICRILLTRLQIEVRLMGPLVASPNPVIFSPFAVPMANASTASFGRC